MTARKVQLKDSLGRVIRINPEATEGAVIGVNLFWPDGTIATASQIANSVTTVTVGGAISQSSVAWGSVLGKPSAFPSAWGQISGVLGDQSDLQAALDAKAAVSHTHPLSDLLQSGAADGDVPTWNTAQAQWLASAPSGGSSSSGILPVVTGEVLNGQPVFVYLDDGSLIHTQVA